MKLKNFIESIKSNKVKKLINSIEPINSNKDNKISTKVVLTKGF